MMILEDNRTALRNYITNLTADGNTSLDIGMKWGSILLDPTFQPVVAGLSQQGHIPAMFNNRPVAYTDRDTIKVIVLMTDGQNTTQYFIEPSFRAGDSNIWWNDQEEVYSVYVGLDTWDEDNDGITNEPLFYWPHTNQWRNHAYGEGVYEETQYTQECTSFRNNGSCRRYRTVAHTVLVNEPGSAEVLTYADLWAYTSMEAVVRSLYAPWMNWNQAWNDWFWGPLRGVNGTTKNTQTLSMCNAAKNAGIIVFTIGFEAPASGNTILQQCASSVSHFFDVQGLEISDAFDAIASSIRQLRLTQ
jgi:hypothetical protein